MKYRHPELFAGQTVALLGANYSGMDFALHLSIHVLCLIFFFRGINPSQLSSVV
jgi:hypothetical protein